MIKLFILAVAVLLGAVVGVVLVEVRHGKRKPKQPEWGSEAWQVAQLEELYRAEARR